MKTVVTTAIVFGVCMLPKAWADDKSVITEKAKTGDQKAEVKTTSVKNDVKKKKPAPASKAQGGTKRSGPDSCDVHIDNQTPWKIQIFIDGDFEGMVGPWGDGTRPDVLNGRTRLFGRADFEDGKVLTWGPKMFNCTAYSKYTWRLDE